MLKHDYFIIVKEPFDTVNEKYFNELRGTDGDNQVEALYKCLGYFDLDNLLGGLFELIETYVKYAPDEELDWR